MPVIEVENITGMEPPGIDTALYLGIERIELSGSYELTGNSSEKTLMNIR